MSLLSVPYLNSHCRTSFLLTLIFLFQLLAPFLTDYACLLYKLSLCIQYSFRNSHCWNVLPKHSQCFRYTSVIIKSLCMFLNNFSLSVQVSFSNSRCLWKGLVQTLSVITSSLFIFDAFSFSMQLQFWER